MVKKTQRAEKKGVVVVNKGAWTSNEDQKLMDYVAVHGDRKWRTLPAKAGLNRCGKSCRLRWLNYLRPGIKRGNISEDEEDLIIRLHNLIGNRWSLIAGRLPGRTDNEIKNHWNTHLCKKSLPMSDLNSKLNLKLEDSRSGSGSLSHTSFAPEPTSGCMAFPAETNRAASDEHGRPAAAPELDRDTGIGRLVGVEDYSIDAGLETCQSPSGIWFQPFSGEEYSGYDDLYMADMADCLLYFP